MAELDKYRISKIAPTSLLTSYAKGFSKFIPFADEVSELTHAERAKKMSLFSKADKATTITGIITRHRSLDSVIRLLLRTGPENHGVLELGAGMTPRGLNLALDYPVGYVGIDASEYINLMNGIYQKIIMKNGLKLKGEYHFENVNVQDSSEFLNSTSFSDKNNPILIINEGFLPWFSENQLRGILPTIREILSMNPNSKWVTPDVSITKETTGRFFGKDENRVNEDIRENHATDVHENLPSTRAYAEAFYDSEGFRFVKYRYMLEYLHSELLNLSRRGFDTSVAENRADAILDMTATYVLELK